MLEARYTAGSGASAESWGDGTPAIFSGALQPARNTRQPAVNFKILIIRQKGIKVQKWLKIRMESGRISHLHVYVGIGNEMEPAGGLTMP